MAAEPLSTPRNDPTAGRAIGRVMRAEERERMPRIVYHPSARPAPKAMAGDDALYRLFRMFHHYTQGEKEMPKAHKAFLVEVRQSLKSAGYRTRDPAKGDPLGGDG